MQSIAPGAGEHVRGAANATFRSLRVRNFRLFFGGQLVSQAGNWMTLIAQTLLVLHLTHDGVAVGLMTACQFLPVLLFGAWAGVIADRSDKRRLLIGIQTFAMVQSFALAALAFMDHPPLISFYLLAMAGGLATAFDNPARRSFVVEMVPEQDVSNAVSLNSALMTGSRMVGPALAGVVIQLAGYGWCFAIDGISYIAVIAAMAVSAIAGGNAWGIVGALLFVASDSLIAENRFVAPRSWAPLAIMVTYHLALAGLVIGLV